MILLVLFSLFFTYCNSQVGIVASSRKKQVQNIAILDSFPNAIAAYSTEYKLFSNYTNSLVAIRRTSDNAERNFRALRVNNYLDTIAFKNFVGVSSGVVVALLDQSGNGLDASQSTAANQPLLVLNNPYGARLSNDFSNDNLLASLPNNASYRVFISGWFGTQSYIGRTNDTGQTTIPFGTTGALTTGDISTVIYYPENELDSIEIQKIIDVLNSKLSDYSPTDFLRLRWSKAGAKTLPALTGTYSYVDKYGVINNAEYSRTVEAKDWLIVKSFGLSGNLLISGKGLQGQIISIPSGITTFNCGTNQLTGSILELPSSLTGLYCSGNQLTGSIPIPPNNLNILEISVNKLTGNIPPLNNSLVSLRFSNNQITGNIPQLNNNLVIFQGNNNQLTGFSSTSVPVTLGDFRVDNNLLPLVEIEKILSAFVAAGKNSGTRVLSIGGTGNASIETSTQAKADVDTLRSRGWTVKVNGY